MNEMMVFTNYDQFKHVMDVEVSEAAAGFVRIGYLLKQARDTNIVQQAGYADVNEFAKANYGLTRDMVSRYIDINDRYSEGGNSMELMDKYKGYGYSKLAEMLTLPDAIIDEIAPGTTREEIRELKREYREEQKVSDIEVMLEEPEDRAGLDNNLKKMVFALLEEQTVLYAKLYNSYNIELTDEENAKNSIAIMAPNGTAVHMARVPQVGRLMLSIKDGEQKVQLVNMRSNEKEEYLITQLQTAIEYTWPASSSSAEDAYLTKYGKSMQKEEPKQEEKKEVAPAQQPEKTESKPKAAAVEKAFGVGKLQSVPENKENETENKENVPICEEKPQETVENVQENEDNAQEIKKDARKEAPVEQCTDDAPQINEPIEEPAEKVQGSVISIIEKKIRPEYFKHIMNGSKTFEIRKDEDGIQPGDTLILKEWDEEMQRYSGRQEEVTISYVLRNAEQYGLMPGYCIMCWGN